jgi:hypothetical protein
MHIRHDIQHDPNRFLCRLVLISIHLSHLYPSHLHLPHSNFRHYMSTLVA